MNISKCWRFAVTLSGDINFDILFETVTLQAIALDIDLMTIAEFGFILQTV